MYGHLLFYVNTYSISQKRQQECISSIEAYDNKKKKYDCQYPIIQCG